MSLFGSVELGGTKTLVGVASDPEGLDYETIPTRDPESTLGSVVAVLKRQDIDAVGIASFGPIELRAEHPQFGSITNTPKPGWRDTEVLHSIRGALEVPAALDTDVNGAALGESRWGAATNCRTMVYLTVGTGIGGGLVVDGEPVVGLGHPEMGHMVVERLPGDDYPGGCPFHGDCLEGMASGPALMERFGPHDGWSAGQALETVAHYLGQAVRNIVYTVAPEIVVVGGGVSGLEGFHSAIEQRLVTDLGGYPGIHDSSTGFVVPPGLGGLSGLAGGLILAQRALER